MKAIINILYLQYVFLKALMFDKNECLGSIALLYAKDMSCIVFDWSRLYIQFLLGVKDCIFSEAFPAHGYHILFI